MNMSTQHEQVGIFVKNYGFMEVDKGIENIIQTLWHYGFSTANSCIDNFGKIWINFFYFEEVKELYQVALTDHLKLKVYPKYGEGKDFDTLYEFFINACKLELLFEMEWDFDSNYEDTNPTGETEHSISMRFDKKLLPQFRDLFFKLFPAPISTRVELTLFGQPVNWEKILSSGYIALPL